MKTIRYFGKVYEVVQTSSLYCVGCAFNTRRCCPKGKNGELCMDLATPLTNVIFKPVKR